MTAAHSREQNDGKNQSLPIYRIVMLLPYLVLIVSAWAVFGETTDDPFITFRYAANLCSGYGAVYNVGERVEGFTSWLHLLVCGALFVLLPGLGMLIKAKCVSLLCGLIVLYQTCRFAARLQCTPLTIFAAQMLLACNVNFAIASVNALETTLFTMVLFAAVTTFFTEMQSGQGILSGGLLFLACLTRPEALIYAALLIGIRLFWGRHKGLSRRFFGQWLVGFAVPLAAFIGLRLWYYGYPFPNTYYAKAVTWQYGVTNGLPYLRRPFLPWLLPFFAWQTIAVAGYWSLAVFGFVRLRREPVTLLFGAIVLGNLLFVLKVGGDWMNGCRFLIPILPFVTLLQVRGVAAWAQKRQDTLRQAIICGIATLTLLALMDGYHQFPLGTWTRHGSPTQDAALLAACAHPYGETWITIGQFFQKELRAGDSIAYSEAGYAAYVNRDKHFLDTFGLTDSEIAHVTGVDRCPFGVVTMFWNPPSDPVQQILRRRKPDYVIIGSVAMPKPMPQRLMQDYAPMPLPPKWKAALETTQFGFYQRRGSGKDHSFPRSVIK